MDRTHSRSKPVNEKTPTPSQPGGSQHVLPPLPYDYSSLEPIIDTATMKLHHDEHHATYVDKLNEAIAPYPNLRERSATWLLLNGESVPESVRKVVHENAGGHVNHSLFWRLMSPPNAGGPTGTLARALDSAFGSVEYLQVPLRRTRRQGVWIGLGVARQRLRHTKTEARDRDDVRARESDRARPVPAARQRCLGTRLLSEAPESAP